MHALICLPYEPTFPFFFFLFQLPTVYLDVRTNIVELDSSQTSLIRSALAALILTLLESPVTASLQV